MACMANHVDVYPFQSRDVFNLNFVLDQHALGFFSADSLKQQFSSLGHIFPDSLVLRL